MSTINEEPFALTEAEAQYTPDDWAWQFLRLNSEYKEAYARAYEYGTNNALLDEIRSHLVNGHLIHPADMGVAAESGAMCARDFGIAAWLDPAHETLPKVKGAGSWFSPLKRIVQEDPCLAEVGETWPVQKRLGIAAREFYPRLSVAETPFGYEKAEHVNLCNTRHRERMVWVAVDCSVPPDAQISALKRLAELHRACWREGTRYERLPTTDTPTVTVQTVDYENIFSHVVFRRTHDAGISTEDRASFWRVVGIDALGPIVTETESCLQQLCNIHRQFQ